MKTLAPVITAAKSAAVIKDMTAQLARSSSRLAASFDAALVRCAVHAQRFGDARLASPVLALMTGAAKARACQWYAETTGHAISAQGVVGSRESEPNPALLDQKPSKYESAVLSAQKAAKKIERDAAKAKATREQETATRAARLAERDRQAAFERLQAENARLRAEMSAVRAQVADLTAERDAARAERDAAMTGDVAAKRRDELLNELIAAKDQLYGLTKERDALRVALDAATAQAGAKPKKRAAS